MALDMPNGTRCFIDANCLYYSLVDEEPFTAPCIALLRRIGSGEIAAVVSSGVVSDVLHKVMLSDATAQFARPRAGLLRWLRDHPEAVCHLNRHVEALKVIRALPLQILPVTLDVLADATPFTKDHGLLMGDAIIAGLMKRHNLQHLVTNDSDFDRVPGITVWKPR